MMQPSLRVPEANTIISLIRRTFEHDPGVMFHMCRVHRCSDLNYRYIKQLLIYNDIQGNDQIESLYS
jgi:hypothetical protein